MKIHKNSFKRFYGQDYIYYIVVKTKNNYLYFKEPIFCELLLEELKLCKQLKNFKLCSFSLIYDHLNLLIQPGDDYNISKIMKPLKENSSRDINKIMASLKGAETPPNSAGAIPRANSVGATSTSRLQSLRTQDLTPLSRQDNDTTTCRRQIREKIEIFKSQFNEKYRQNPFPKFRWQKSFYDHVVGGDLDFDNHFDYTAENFIKHGLPEDWPYTSYNYPEM